MIQGAQGWTGLIGLTDIYCSRSPRETFSGGPESLTAPQVSEEDLSFCLGAC